MGGPLVSFGAPSTNTGEMRVVAGPAQIAAFALTNHGTVHLNADTIMVGRYTNDGLWRVGAGAVVQVSNAEFTHTGGDLQTLGTLRFEQSVLRFNGGVASGDAPIISGDLHIGPGSTGAAAFVLTTTAAMSGDIAPDQTIIVDGALAATAMAPFQNGGELNITSVDLPADSSFGLASGSITNIAGGMIRFEPGAGGSRTLAAALDNRGSVHVGAAATIGRGGAASINSGDILLAGSSLGLEGTSFTNQPLGLIRGDGAITGLSSLFINNGAISPGSALGELGAIGFTPFFSQGAGGVVQIDIADPGPNGLDRLSIVGAAILDGTVEVTLVGGYAPQWGARWTMMTYGVHTGDMALVAPLLADPALRWWSEATPTSWDLGVRHLADINRDGVVNFGDLNLVLSSFNTVGANLPGDADESGAVDFADLNLVLSFFNTSAAKD